MVIAVDFSSGQEIYPQLSEQLQNLDIGVLGMRVSETGQGEAHTHLINMVLPFTPGL